MIDKKAMQHEFVKFYRSQRNDFDPEQVIQFAEHIAALARADAIEEYDGKSASYEDVLRTIASYVGNGGYNAESPINSEVFTAKIIEGIDAMIKASSNLARNGALEEAISACDDLHDTWRWDDEPDSASGPRDCMAAIRALKDKEPK